MKLTFLPCTVTFFLVLMSSQVFFLRAFPCTTTPDTDPQSASGSLFFSRGRYSCSISPLLYSRSWFYFSLLTGTRAGLPIIWNLGGVPSYLGLFSGLHGFTTTTTRATTLTTGNHPGGRSTSWNYNTLN